MSLDELREAVFALPAEDRLKVAEELWDSIDPEEPVAASAGEAAGADPTRAIPDDPYFRRVEARYGGALYALPAEDRERLAGELWDSAHVEDEAPPSPELIAEIERRAAYLEAHPESGLTWEEVKAYIRGRHGR